MNDSTLDNPNPYPYWEKILSDPHVVDQSYDTNFSATAISKQYAMTESHQTLSDHYVDANDPCTIHEVYTDGCCKVTYPAGNTTRTYYFKIDNFKWFTPVSLQVTSPFTISSLEAGNYTAYVTAANSIGYCDSSKVSFTVYPKPNFEVKATVTDNGHTYMLYDDVLTWTQAKAKCEELGGHLVTITSAHEQSVINGIIGKGNRESYWIGASDAVTEGTFRWVTGEPFSYTNWSTGEPNNDENEDYANLWVMSDYFGLWNDHKSDASGSKIGFILEKEQTYTVSYNANGGTGAPASQEKKHGFDLTLSAQIPARDGFTFLGWAEKADATTAQYQPKETFTANKNVTLYAVWREKTISSITIKKLPAKMIYTVGEKFDPTGMIVKINYTDGTSREITSGYTCTPTGAMNTAGQQTIAVSYKENGVTKGTGFKVTVNG